jgi:hypothetical protein
MQFDQLNAARSSRYSAALLSRGRSRRAAARNIDGSRRECALAFHISGVTPPAPLMA